MPATRRYVEHFTGFVLCLTLCYSLLVFFSPFSIATISLGEERANLSAFLTFFRFVLVCFCRFPLPLGVWEGLRFVIVAFPGLLLPPFSFVKIKHRFTIATDDVQRLGILKSLRNIGYTVATRHNGVLFIYLFFFLIYFQIFKHHKAIAFDSKMKVT